MMKNAMFQVFPADCYLSSEQRLSESFFNPFGVDVHPLAVLASRLLQEQLQEQLQYMTELKDGKDGAEKRGIMFGVLVVKDEHDKFGFLSAYSGSRSLVAKACNISFVPSLLADSETLSDPEMPCFLKNALGEEERINDVISRAFSSHKVKSPHNNPSSIGIGDCAGPKLLQYAYFHQYTPIALAEFWFGSSANHNLRHHQQFYPSCRGKCWPILPFMMQGLNVKPLIIPGFRDVDKRLPEVIYEDDFLLIVNKPAGLLSVPGKDVQDSVLTRLQKKYPEATGPLLLHRLDLLTSGLLLAAKDETTHKLLQRQFLNRTIKKRYVALLCTDNGLAIEDNGVIELPLRVDIDDRPRQMVCHQHGKKSQTQWRVVSRNEHTIRLYFYPITGRTHQLRVHAAHYKGLNAPIIGDPLYGRSCAEKFEKSDASINDGSEKRLMLHAEQLTFTHPVTEEEMMIKSPVPF